LGETSLENAVLNGCHIRGISAWDVKLSEGTKQQGLIITRGGEPAVIIDDLEDRAVRLPHPPQRENPPRHRHRRQEGRAPARPLHRGPDRGAGTAARGAAQAGYVPIVFNFDKPETKDFTETVRLLAGLSKFVIADITKPKSSPLELQATVPEIMVPFQPIIQQGEEPFAMLKDLQRKHDWVFKTLRYSSLDRLIETMDDEIIKLAEAKFKQLLARRAEEIEDREI
jgi:hypothetical protein